MGDVAMTVPVVASFAKKYPNANITMVSNPRFEDMFHGIKNLTFFGVDTKNKYKGFGGIFKLFSDLSATKKFDVVIDLHDVLRSKVMRALFRIKGVKVFKIDKGRAEKKALTAKEGKVLKQLKSSVERYRDVFAEAGVPFDLTFDSLMQKGTPLSANLAETLGEKHGKWIAIAPFAQHQGKIYPLDKMETVVKLLSEEPDTKVLLFGGGAKEKTVLEDWEKKYGNTVSLAGKFPLLQELEILNHTDTLVSMDSANMHLASLVGTRVVSVWGTTHTCAGFYGFGQNPADTVELQMDCRPCSIYGNKPCKFNDYRCMTNIEPETIVNKVLKLNV